MKKFRFLTQLLAAILPLTIAAQDIPEPMSPPRLVNDFAGILNPNELYSLEAKLRNYHDTTSNQIYVVTVKDLAGYDAGDFAFRLGEKWRVGQKGKNNGIVILIKPKYGNERGQAFIATGYGMEDVVPDAITNRIVDNAMIPHFKEGNYYAGIDAAINTIIDLASGKYTAEQYQHDGSTIGGFLFVIIFMLIIIFSISKGQRNMKGRSMGHNIPFWIAMGMLANRGGGGGFGNFSSGSGSFGGGGFGGFGGGGGGSFGGGGAGGSW